jgi:hypothetical protein
MVIAKPEWFKKKNGILIIVTAFVGAIINFSTRYKLEKES